MKGGKYKMVKQAKNIDLQDNLNIQDVIGQSRGFRTEIIATNELGEELFRESNSLVIGGALFTLEKLFNVSSPLSVDYLNNIMGFGTTGTPVTEIYPRENGVCLFGVGIGGAGDSLSSVNAVDIKDRELPTMIPFRSSSTSLTEVEKKKYFGKKLENGKTRYYLKKFEAQPQIRALWRDGIDGADGSAVEPNVHESVRTEPIETFAELVLKIDEKDCLEFFQEAGQVEKSRINSIGLFTGVPVVLEDGSTEYKQVKLFSMLNIFNEMLTGSKELNLHYRIYTL